MQSFNIDAIMAAMDRVKDENEGLRVEVLELRGRLRESRRAARRLGKIVAEGKQREKYWHQLIVAAVGIAVALTSLVYTFVIVERGLGVMQGLIWNLIALACWWINFRIEDRRGDWLFAGISLAMFVLMLCRLFVNISKLMGGGA